MQERLQDFDDENYHENMREFWFQYSQDHGIQETINEMYRRADGSKEGTAKMVYDIVTANDDYLSRFPTLDVIAFAIYKITWAPTWKIVESIGGINEDNFYIMFNETYTVPSHMSIPLWEK